MTRRRLFSFYIDEDLAEGLKAVKDRDGVNESEQVRRALRAHLEAKGIIKPKADRLRAGTRKRP
jgi:hypothetical protein